MRRALLPLLPAFANQFGILPWDTPKLTFREIQVFRDWIEARARNQSQAASRARR